MYRWFDSSLMHHDRISSLIGKAISIEVCLVIGVYVNLVDDVIWDHGAVGSSPATPIVAVAEWLCSGLWFRHMWVQIPSVT